MICADIAEQSSLSKTANALQPVSDRKQPLSLMNSNLLQLFLTKWQAILYWGVQKRMHYPHKERIVLCNQLILALISLTILLALVLLFIVQLPLIAGLMLLKTLFFATILLLNKNQHTNLSSICLCVAIPFSILGVTLYMNMASSRVEVVTYFALRLLLLSSVLLPLILFELRQRAYLIFGIGWVVVCLLLANPLHRSLGIAPEQVGLQFNYYFLVDFISLFCIVLIVSSFFFLQRISREYEKRHTLLLIALQVSNEELTHNKQSVEVTTQELFATNQTLREQNEQIDAQKTLLQVGLEENYKVNEQLQQAKEEIQTLLEEQLRQSELKFQELTESITEMFFALDNKLQFLYWNKACERLTGKPAKAVLGTSVYEMFPTFRGRRTEATLQNVLASKQPVSYEYWDKITYTHFEVNIFPSNMGLVILLKDITDKKKKAWQVEQLNEQLLISNRELNQRNFELDQIVYKISHDIRSPLASVLGLVNLLQLEEMGEGVREYTIKIGGQILKLDRFTKLMLEFARTTRSALQCHQIDFEQLKNQCLAELEYLPHFARLHVTLHQEGLPLYTDALHMQIIFANLVANAIKYQYVERNLSYLHILITVHEKEAQMVFKDNGIGIDKEYLPRIFDMFFRASTQSNGSGLGMYIVKQTVEKLGGKVELESILGEGTIVTIKIPNRVSRNEKTIFSASAGVSKVESIQ